MFGTCISYEMIVSVRPCLGHGIDLRYEPVQCKIMSGTWHRLNG
ncbi:hypothetical protein F383_08072 [Gossypium arboreum]|uniref:Uncharacterized protein n=1 Tax=Gossypium arboreum TaxID=29729 RepID=A0A0B0PHC9_GOSAR|nr:hypothetical protein F383_08072 [Gossypium arboreum]